MPLYEYTCSNCGENFEALATFSQADNCPQCPACKSIETHRKLSRIASQISSNGSSSTSASISSSCGSSGGFR